MAETDPSSKASTLANDKMAETADKSPYNDGEKGHSLERLGSQNNSTEANIFSEREGTAEADLEKTGAAPPAAPGGINPADFPDGGFEAWLVVFGGWCCLFCCMWNHQELIIQVLY